MADWPLGIRPDSPPTYVLVDGLGSEGSNLSPPSLFGTLGPVIKNADQDAHLTCLSYSHYGKEYHKSHTGRSLLGHWPGTLIAPFLRGSTAQSTTVAAFSQGCSLTVLGLSRVVDLLAAVQHVILVQPAFTVRDEVIARLAQLIAAPGEEEFRLSFAASELLEPDHDLQSALIDAMTTITKTTPVTVVYWPHDPFLDYNDWPAQWDAAGVRHRAVDEDLRPDPSPPPESLRTMERQLIVEFVQHLRVPSRPNIQTAVEQLIRPPSENDA